MSIPAQKTVSEKLKTWHFPYSAFWLTDQWKGYSPPPRPLPGYTTGINKDSDNFPPSHLPSVPPSRKSPTRRKFSDQISEFKQKDEIKYFSQINERVCAPTYQLKLRKNKAIFYETENFPVNDISLVTETIVVTDSLNVKLFWKAIPVPLSEGFRKGSNCRLKSKSILDNFPSYLRSIAEQEPNNLQHELQYI